MKIKQGPKSIAYRKNHRQKDTKVRMKNKNNILNEFSLKAAK